MLLKIVIMIAIVLAGSLPANAARAGLDSLKRLPTDSAEAARTRIWVPIENVTTCRTKIIIVDDSGQAVRHYLNELLPRGYHNFYWDKRDDSGVYVRSGDYLYHAVMCGRRQYGKLSAVYLPGELESNVELIDCIGAAHFEWELMVDSTIVSAFIENVRGRLIDTLFQDSLCYRGRHLLEWTPAYGYAGFFTRLLAAAHLR